MLIARKIKNARTFVLEQKAKGRTVALVPTMGAIHEGHLSLVRRARLEADIVVVSIFVNPLQFGPKEDLKKYPRREKDDLALLRNMAVDMVFLPEAQEMYPDGHETAVEVKGLDAVLCGKFRPGHFRGVATVVLKLFNIISPDVALFGAKDYQQYMIIEQMCKDLDLPLRLVLMPIVRETDGLALSSRNVRLTPSARRSALRMVQTLDLAEQLVGQGIITRARLTKKLFTYISAEKGLELQYLELVHPQSLSPVKEIGKDGALLGIAGLAGKVRLIDNRLLMRPETSPRSARGKRSKR